jgi:hypothetical protein
VTPRVVRIEQTDRHSPGLLAAFFRIVTLTEDVGPVLGVLEMADLMD